MSLEDQIQIVPADAQAAFIPPPETAKVKPEPDGPTLEEALERNEQLTEQLDALNQVLAKPLAEILADRENADEAALAWDRFGAMWMLSQRAMRRVALDLAAQLGVSEQEVVARAMDNANAVLNGADEVDLGGTVAPAQLQHIARHRAFLRKQFKTG
jgi:cell division septum initiation protein DivIVA